MTDTKIKKHQQVLYKTLIYSDIFHYPLSGEQLFLYCSSPLKRKDFFTVIKTIPHVIANNVIYYFLPGKKINVKERIRREKISLKKMRDVKTVVRILSLIPTIQCIGVSGSLALLFADTTHDSDLFFIVKKHTVWITRLLVYVVLIFLGRKRKKTNTGNAICANLFLDESDLQMEKKKRNLYIAHEIIQTVPLFNKNKAYEKFLYRNVWIKKFFPNISFPKRSMNKKTISFSSLFIPLEFIARVTQIAYMKNKMTRETITPTRIAFHPIDYEKIILRAYEKKRRRYGV